MLIYGRALSDAERQSVEQYLRDKYFPAAVRALVPAAPLATWSLSPEPVLVPTATISADVLQTRSTIVAATTPKSAVHLGAGAVPSLRSLWLRAMKSNLPKDELFS